MINLHAIFKAKFRGCVLFFALTSPLFSQSIIATFTQILDHDTFVFKPNPFTNIPCKLYGVEIYDASKCTSDKKTIDKFNKFYSDQIYKIIKPGQNFYIQSRQNLGNRWLCVISDEKRILNKTLVKNALAKPKNKEYKKIKITSNSLKSQFPTLFECLDEGKISKPQPKDIQDENPKEKQVKEQKKIEIEIK